MHHLESIGYVGSVSCIVNWIEMTTQKHHFEPPTSDKYDNTEKEMSRWQSFHHSLVAWESSKMTTFSAASDEIL